MEFIITISIIALVVTGISMDINIRITREQNKKIIELLKQLNEK
ncbi:hypothetical protein SM124_11610 [Bacillus sp. 31A1R]|uniref:Uncharacterized protein n=1 Tax=Robertmurraya mangrovi TaxID=3098077 RepID=A0ABU5IYZ2_9BACI|nr:hypothetical protein [Bacillus sp. 31A1R]MDZ5472394.1 hypothetical protein [Bacillus sp. 31A1R]